MKQSSDPGTGPQIQTVFVKRSELRLWSQNTWFLS